MAGARSRGPARCCSRWGSGSPCRSLRYCSPRTSRSASCRGERRNSTSCRSASPSSLGGGAAVVVAGAAILALAGGRLIGLLESSLRFGLTLDPENMREPSRLVAVATQVAWPGLMILAPFMLLLAGVGFVADLLVGGWIVSTKPITPDFTRIDPLKGFGRLFSQAAL